MHNAYSIQIKGKSFYTLILRITLGYYYSNENLPSGKLKYYMYVNHFENYFLYTEIKPKS